MALLPFVPMENLLVCVYFLCTFTFHLLLQPDTLLRIWRAFLVIRLMFHSYELMEVLLSIKYAATHRLTSPTHHAIENTDAITVPPLHVIIVAYLPNEKDIVIEHVCYALTQIKYPPELLTIHLAYNTPFPMPEVEAPLHDLMKTHPILKVNKVHGSTSKAANINYLLDRLPSQGIAAIYDTDHKAHPLSPIYAATRLSRSPAIAALQGRCIPRNVSASLLSALVAVEFDMLYVVTHLGRDRLWETAMFNGSNAYWRLEVLKKLRLDPKMMTEDIDVSVRALAAGYTIVHDPQVISYELAPSTIWSFWSQRLRWAQGWTQISTKYRGLPWGYGAAGHLKARQRMGLLLLILVREVNTHLQLQFYCAMASLTGRAARDLSFSIPMTTQDKAAMLLR
jgi:cellulose synthase/poly-beta-1,6-N-acetylglucosamine synthase-like glycosyltransferase